MFGSTDPSAAERLVTLLAASGDAPLSADQAIPSLFFDTFDWRIFRKGWALMRVQEIYRLVDRFTGELLAEQSVEGSRPPRFAWDLDQGSLRDLLTPVIKVRSLLHLLTIRWECHTREAVHPKSGNRWFLEHGRHYVLRRGHTKPLVETVSPRPAGTDQRGRKWITRRILKAGFKPLPPTLLEPALRAAGIKPQGYSGKVRVPLEPDLPAGEAIFLIADHLLRTMKANLPGVKKDIDTEFLHDFRVAVRRTRSLLALTKGVLPPGVRKEAQAKFKRIGGMTGPLRDLDVYLLRYPEYLELLPAEFHPGLKEIFARVIRRRASIRGDLDARLAENELSAFLYEWDQFLAEGAPTGKAAPADSQLPIGTLAGRLIAKRYRRLVKLGNKALAQGTDEALHQLRIEGKKLRYCLEFFASLYSARTVRELLRTLKKLQDHLGDHNDLVIQLADLHSLLTEKRGARLSDQAAAAVGALIVKLGERKAEVHDRIAGVFAGFAGRKTAKALKNMVGVHWN
jgi:CHAD domain-containing protein